MRMPARSCRSTTRSRAIRTFATLSRGVEYATSAVSAATVDVQLEAVVAGNVFLSALGLDDLIPQFDPNLLATNPHIRHAASTRNGVMIVEIGPQALDVEMVQSADVTAKLAGPTESVAFRTPLGTKRVMPA